MKNFCAIVIVIGLVISSVGCRTGRETKLIVKRHEKELDQIKPGMSRVDVEKLLKPVSSNRPFFERGSYAVEDYNLDDNFRVILCYNIVSYGLCSPEDKIRERVYRVFVRLKSGRWKEVKIFPHSDQ